MDEYDKNVSTVLTCMHEKNFSDRTIKIYDRMYKAIRQYLVRTNQQYSPQLGDVLLERNDDDAFKYKSDHQRVACIKKLNAVYKYGDLNNVFLNPRKDYVNVVLNERLAGDLDKFITYCHSKFSTETVVGYKCAATAFMKYVQSRGRMSVDEITYDDIQAYHESLSYLPYASKVTKETSVQNMLFFHSVTGNVNPGKWRFLFLLEHDRYVCFEDLPSEKQTAINNLRDKSLSYPADKFFSVGNELASKIRNEGYATDYAEALEKAILYLHVFLDVNNLGYDPEIADIWISCDAIKKVFRGKSSLDSARRMLNLFKDYADSKECHFDYIYRNSVSSIDTLPLWCQSPIHSFIAQRKEEKIKKNTISSNIGAIYRFCKFIVENGATSYADVTGELVASFNAHDVHNSVGGKNAYNCTIRRFLKHLARANLVDNPSIYMILGSSARPYESIVTTLTQDEIETARAYVDNASTPTEIRDSAMFMLGADMGLRGVDIAGLRVTDVNLTKSYIKFRQSKTGKDVILSMPTEVGNIIFRYLRDVRPKPCKTDFLFVGIYKPHQRIRRGVCYDALHRILPDRQVPGSGFHVTRKTFSTNRLKNGVDPMSIADALGQSDTRSLTSYLSLDEEHMSMCPMSIKDMGIQFEGGFHV